jgi:hypothetical protein
MRPRIACRRFRDRAPPINSGPCVSLGYRAAGNDIGRIRTERNIIAPIISHHLVQTKTNRERGRIERRLKTTKARFNREREEKDSHCVFIRAKAIISDIDLTMVVAPQPRIGNNDSPFTASERGENPWRAGDTHRINLRPQPLPPPDSPNRRTVLGEQAGPEKTGTRTPPRPRNCIPRRTRGPPPPPACPLRLPLPYPRGRASPAKRMHFGCSCEFVRASNARMREVPIVYAL